MTQNAINYTSPEVPIGSMQYFDTYSGSTYPSPNWIKCDGSIVNQSDYPSLYSSLGLWASPGTVFKTNYNMGLAGGTVLAVGYGNSLYVCAGSSGFVATSTDSVTWTARTSGSTSQLNTTLYSGSLYMIGGNGSALLTSTDGTSWTAQTIGVSFNVVSSVYANSLYTIVGSAGNILTSTDAVTWTSRTSSTTSQLSAIIYVSGVYLTGGNGGVMRSSTDSITWTSVTTGFTSAILCMTYGNGIYVAGGASGLLATSTNGTTWTTRTSNTTSSILGITYSTAAGKYYFGTSGGLIGFSTDGTTWTTYLYSQNFNAISCAFTNTDYILLGSSNTFFKSANTYDYNSATQFQLPRGYVNLIETGNVNLTKTLYIKAK